MKSIYDFIIQPLGDKYSNTVKIAGADVVVNTKIENWKFVNRLAVVIQTPLAFNSKIKGRNNLLNNKSNLQLVVALVVG